ncbi:cobalt-precorrin-6A reductase [Williamsia maris]|uniref:Precorrin-6A/cobalt-precorrin-6A reductase n=1 Tax=Williamsia maris TaxID=72806 RepID=A0ABT1HJV8_9NOCA|nr:cobalt-precorrin-6A reductase [Williamsia maris]MCP2178232.1 precorrin-6A/cobalt-precorrin-6A reductase [Williamsia maris]
MNGRGPVLILGGTAEARALAAELDDRDVPYISSLAGRVQQPRLPVGEVRIGGFGGPTALRAWIVDHDCRAVIDVTHPFAQQISRNAADATTPLDVPLIAFRRPEWVPTAADRWTIVDDITAAAAAVSGHGRRILLTTGRQDVTAFAGDDSALYLIRVVDPPTGDLPPHHRIIRSRGPYDLDSELTLLRDNDIDTLVTKNSGGEHTRAKLVAARELGVAVVMVARPPSPVGVDVLDTVDAVISRLLDRSAER